MPFRTPLLLCSLAGLLASCETLPQAGAPGYRPTGQVYHGKMSWYSVKTNGGTATASGERFHNESQTAAHKTLPLGTVVKVTNLANDRSEVVRINDRGPYIHGRIIDVSIGVASKLDFVGRGVAPCKVEVLEPIGQGSFLSRR